MLIYVEYITERLLYTLSFVLADRSIDYSITNDSTQFLASKKPKLNYSDFSFEGILQINPATVLFEDELLAYEPHQGTFNDTPCLQFEDRPDLLASIFYVLSRMEEYNSASLDSMNRFKSSASVLSKFGWLQNPICDLWSQKFISFLEDVLQIDLKTIKPPFAFQPTFDIDNAFAYKNKNNIRSTLALIKDALYNRKQRVHDRKIVRKGVQKDPYDTYDQIMHICQKYPQTKVFWLLGNYTQLDKNLSHLNLAQQNVMTQLEKVTEIGIHFSSLTSNNLQQMQTEAKRFMSITGFAPNANRQHYLMMSLPQTYKLLIKAGILNDFTMGYAEQTGFRAGTARQFKWFDLQKNEITNLLIHPFVYMDGTLKEYLNLNPEQAIKRIHELFNAVSTCGGNFTFLWHNETIGGYEQWSDYQTVFQENFTLFENSKISLKTK